MPWRCSCRGTQRQRGYGSSPGVSVLGKINRVVYSQAHVSTVAPDYIEPSFLWLPSSSLALDTPFQCQLWIAILSHSAHVAKVSKSSLLNPTVDILAQLQSVEDVFVSDVVSSCHSLNLSQTRHLKYLESVLLCLL